MNLRSKVMNNEKGNKAEYRVNIKYEKGKKVKAICSILVGGALLSATLLGGMFAMTGCKSDDSNTGSIDSLQEQVKGVSDAKRLYDGIDILASQYQAGTIKKSDVDSALATAVLLQNAINDNIESMTEEDKGFVGDSWFRLNDINENDAQFEDTVSSKKDYNTLYESVKDMCTKLGICPYKIELDCTSATIKGGEVKKVTATTVGTKQGVKWTSSDSKVAEVNDKGEITGIKDGSCTIVCSTVEDSSVKAEIKVNVKGVKIDKIEASAVSVKEGSTKSIEVKTNAGEGTSGLVFKSLDEKIATVNNKGEVKGIKEGSCEITIMSSDGSVSTTIEVKVTNKYGMKKLDEEKTVYCTGGNLYEAPGTKYNKIQAVSENTEVTVIAENDGWYECKIGDKHGYIGKTVVQDSPVVHESYDGGNDYEDYDYDDYSGYDEGYDDGYDGGSYYEEPAQSYEESGSAGGSSGGSSSSGSGTVGLPKLSGSGIDWDSLDDGDPYDPEADQQWMDEHNIY